jgi:hypothetical protein
MAISEAIRRESSGDNPAFGGIGMPAVEEYDFDYSALDNAGRYALYFTTAELDGEIVTALTELQRRYLGHVASGEIEDILRDLPHTD